MSKTSSDRECLSDKINVEIGCCGSHDAYGTKALRWKRSLLGHLAKLLDVLHAGDVMISDGSRAKLDDAIVQWDTDDGSNVGLLGLTLALEAPRRQLANVFVPLVVSGVANPSWHPKTHTEALKHRE
mgnify:FL=1